MSSHSKKLAAELTLGQAGIDSKTVATFAELGFKKLGDFLPLTEQELKARGFTSQKITTVRKWLSKKGLHLKQETRVAEDANLRAEAAKSDRESTDRRYRKNAELVKLLVSGNPQVRAFAINRLVEINQPLAKRYAAGYSGYCGRGGQPGHSGHRSLEFSDLVQAARIGLWKAAQDFDPALGFAFSTYAMFKMRSEVQGVLRNAHTIDVPAHTRELLTRLRKETSSLSPDLTPVERDNRLCALLELTPEQLEELRQHAQTLQFKGVRFGHQTGFGADDGKLVDEMIPDPNTDPLNEFGRVTAGSSDEQAAEAIERAFQDAGLGPRERMILKERFVEEKTLQEIGDPLNISRERVRQIEARALKKLQHHDLWNGYLHMVIDRDSSFAGKRRTFSDDALRARHDIAKKRRALLEPDLAPRSDLPSWESNLEYLFYLTDGKPFRLDSLGTIAFTRADWPFEWPNNEGATDLQETLASNAWMFVSVINGAIHPNEYAWDPAAFDPRFGTEADTWPRYLAEFRAQIAALSGE